MEANLSAAPYALRIDTGYDGDDQPYDIEVLSPGTLWRWDDHLREQGLDPWSGPATVLFKDWCNRNGVYYYARPNESFSEREALDLAAKAKAKYLLMEGLS